MPLLAIALPSLINLAEGLFPKGDDGQSRGTEKKTFVMEAVTFAVDQLIASGKAPWLKDYRDIAIKAADFLIEAIVEAQKKNG